MNVKFRPDTCTRVEYVAVKYGIQKSFGHHLVYRKSSRLKTPAKIFLIEKHMNVKFRPDTYMRA